METTQTLDLFDQVQIGYLVIESGRLTAWKRFAQQGVGLHLEHESENLLAFRMDGHLRRLIIRRGTDEDVVAVGLQLRDLSTVAEVLARLEARGIPFCEGSAEGAADRGIKSWWYFDGPKRLGVEIFCEAETTTEPLWMLSSGFVTGAGGMGHVAITTRLPEKMLRFWREIFDARVSDYIEEQIAGLTLDITFTRFNERHHSVAIAATRGRRLDPIRTRVQHLNLLVATLDDLGAAYRRLVSLGFEIAHEIGQHPNDKEVSFYVVTPSGFELELGWNPITVNEAGWKASDYYGISLWGHKPRKATLLNFVATNAGNLCRGLKSLLHPEYSPLPEQQR